MPDASRFAAPFVAPVANWSLEQALRDKLSRRSVHSGRLGELEPLAVQLGLVQNSLKPGFQAPELIIFAADHGLAVDGAGLADPPTRELVHLLLHQRLALTGIARAQGLTLSVIDSGMADVAPPHPRLQARKIAHGTRNARTGWAMSQDQVEAALRAGLEIADRVAGNAIACAGVGKGAQESAALVLAQLTRAELPTLLKTQASDGATADPERCLLALQAAQERHRDVDDPLLVLAAFGGFEIAMMVGSMLSAARRRRLIVVDGLPACAAALIASRLAPALPDYCVYCRSHGHHGLDTALRSLNATPLLELGIESTDGTGAALAWPLIRSAAALLTEVADSDELPSARSGVFSPDPDPDAAESTTRR